MIRLEEEKDDSKELLEELKSIPIQKKLLEERKVFLWGPVMDDSAKEIVNKLLYLEMTDLGKEIIYYINSTVGYITD